MKAITEQTNKELLENFFYVIVKFGSTKEKIEHREAREKFDELKKEILIRMSQRY